MNTTFLKTARDLAMTRNMEIFRVECYFPEITKQKDEKSMNSKMENTPQDMHIQKWKKSTFNMPSHHKGAQLPKTNTIGVTRVICYLFKLLFLHVYSMGVGKTACVTILMWRSEDNSREAVLSFRFYTPWSELRLPGQCPPPGQCLIGQPLKC